VEREPWQEDVVTNFFPGRGQTQLNYLLNFMQKESHFHLKRYVFVAFSSVAVCNFILR